MFALNIHRRNPRPGRAGVERIAVGALVCAVGIARAETIYEFRACDGHVEYAQRAPEHGCGAPVRRLAWRDTAVVPEAAVAAVTAAAGAGPLARLDDHARVARARARLQRAIAAQRNGQEPLPGERQHLVNGHSRLRRAYFERLRSLQAAVDRARRELDAALRGADRTG